MKKAFDVNLMRFKEGNKIKSLETSQMAMAYHRNVHEVIEMI